MSVVTLDGNAFPSVLNVRVDGKLRRYVPERTCRVVSMDMAGNPPYRKGNVIYNALSDGCSECGYPFDTENNGVPSYCPHCGARVMPNDRP